ncbi:sulfite exporter TauE/SafE family protein [Congregicoccus parvus]|uniref:sulfite exporter TauE/SafE family protein n=1 Tax=Congregicoccus parvus TaxID=3081749 RepID=UPI003FA5FE09
MTFEPWEWALLAVGAAFVGLSKSGIPGVGILVVGIFSNILPPKLATGMVLPLLLVGDVAAVATYLKHTQWRHVLRLFPWTAIGVVAGWFALGHMSDRSVGVAIGAILLFMLGLHAWRSRRTAAEKLEREVVAHGAWFAPFMGVFAGFTTQMANAAGPVMILYLLAMRLPKMHFLGTSAVYFFALNLFKLPFMIQLGLIDGGSVVVNAWLAPAVLAGSIVGRLVATRVPQKLFERLALGLTFVAALKLLLG